MSAPINTRRCSRCRDTKPVTDFRHSTARGFQAYCRPCHAETQRGRSAVWNQSNPIKRQAHRDVRYALARGDIARTPCVDCGAAKTQAHHRSYAPDRWTDVVWLCSRCHQIAHRDPSSPHHPLPAAHAPDTTIGGAR